MKKFLIAAAALMAGDVPGSRRGLTFYRTNTSFRACRDGSSGAATSTR